MFIILTYDIASKKLPKVMKLCESYLARVQKSVFEGEISEANLKQLKLKLKDTINIKKDKVTIYCLESTKYTVKEEIGLQQEMIHII